MSSKSPLFKAYIAFALVSFFWGTTYLGIRIGVDEKIPPFWLAGLRQSAAGLIVVLYSLIRGEKFPVGKDFPKLIIPGLLMIACGNGLVTWAEQYINSGLTAILCSMNPVWVMILSFTFLRNEAMSKSLVIGIALGFVGILVIFSDSLGDFANPKYLLGIFGIVLANIGWASGTIFVSRYKSSVSPVAASGWQMLIAGLVLASVSFTVENPLETVYTFRGVAALLYLTIFGSVVAYGAFLYVLNHMSPTKSSAYSYINTVVAVILGWLWLDEKITLNIVIGAAITIYGIYLVNSKRYSKAG